MINKVTFAHYTQGNHLETKLIYYLSNLSLQKEEMYLLFPKCVEIIF